jgi:lipid A 3-O-deacylase
MDQSRVRSVWRQGVSGALTIVLFVPAQVVSAQAVSAAGLVMTPATFSVLNPSIFGDNSAVVVGAGYGQRPLAKTYLFSGSLSHVRFQFGRTIWPFPTSGAKSLMRSLDYAHGMYSPAISPSMNVVSGIQGSVGYGVSNYRDGTGIEGVVVGLLAATGVRFSGPGIRLTPYLAPGFFYARQAFVGYECGPALGDCPGQTDAGFQFSFGGGLRLDLLERLSLEAGVRKTQTSNAKSRRSFGISYRFGNLERHGLRDASTFTFQMDNDFFASYRGLLDEDYTQGFHLTFNRRESPKPFSRALDRFEKCEIEQGCISRAMVLVGQEIYTPRYYPSLEDGDRPFAGWLYGGLQSSAVTDRDLTSVSIKAGVTGPPSLAQQLQVTFHELVPTYQVPAGWNDQLKFEPGLILTASRKNFTELRAGAASIGMITNGTASLGNILTDAEAGITLRAGLNAEHPWNFDRARSLGGYASFGVREDIVLHSLFLDGNTFRSGPSVDRIPFVWQKELGAGISMGSILFDCRLIVRSQEFTTGRPHHQYGTVSLTRRGAF